MVERIPSKRPSGVAHPDAHDDKGRFKKNHPVYSRKHRGDKRTGELKDAILHGAAAHGFDGKGKGGLLGYCTMLATKYPKRYTYLLGKTLPLTVRDGVVSVGPVTIQVRPIAAGNFLTHEQMEQMRSGIVIDGHAERVPDDEQDGLPPPKRGPLPH